MQQLRWPVSDYIQELAQSMVSDCVVRKSQTGGPEKEKDKDRGFKMRGVTQGEKITQIVTVFYRKTWRLIYLICFSSSTS